MILRGSLLGASLFEADFCLADDGAVGFTDLDVGLVPVDDLLVETEAVAQVRLCLVGDFEAANALLLKALLGEEVEDVLDVLDAVDVAVDVHVAVVGVDGAQELRLAETETGMALDGTEGPLPSASVASGNLLPFVGPVATFSGYSKAPVAPEGEGLIFFNDVV